jgi:alpha-methylacyl-CoA racemase
MTLGTGPLAGLRILEFAGLGPAPFCGMLFSDLGADVVRIDRPSKTDPYQPADTISRGRRSVALDLKNPQAIDIALRLADQADILIEGFRPGVMERLGLGPDILHARKPSLVYGRMTGWGQTGARARAPGHDINYIGLTGALHAIGPAEQPAIPLNLVGDFGGGALYLAFGTLAALIEARSTGKGQVVDCAMVDGAVSLMTMLFGRLGADDWHDRRMSNSIDGGSHFYNTYECADGLLIACGAIEPQFYTALLELMGLDEADFQPQRDQARWPEWKARIAERFRAKPRAEWLAILGTRETCCTPVLTMTEAVAHPDNADRDMFRRIDGVLHAMPVPRFSASPDIAPGTVATKAGAHNAEALGDWGFDAAEIRTLQENGTLAD